jgi:hypothetical protein
MLFQHLFFCFFHT